MDEETAAQMARLGLPVSFVSTAKGPAAAAAPTAPRVQSGPVTAPTSASAGLASMMQRSAAAASARAPAALPSSSSSSAASVASQQQKGAMKPAAMNMLAAYGDSDSSGSDSDNDSFGPAPARAATATTTPAANATATVAATASGAGSSAASVIASADSDTIEQQRQRPRLATAHDATVTRNKHATSSTRSDSGDSDNDVTFGPRPVPAAAATAAATPATATVSASASAFATESSADSIQTAAATDATAAAAAAAPTATVAAAAAAVAVPAKPQRSSAFVDFSDDSDAYSDSDSDTADIEKKQVPRKATAQQQPSTSDGTRESPSSSLWTADSAPLSHIIELHGHTRPVTALALAPGNGRVVTGGLDGRLNFYDFGGLDSGFNPWIEKTIADGHAVHHIAFAPRLAHSSGASSSTSSSRASSSSSSEGQLLVLTSGPQPELWSRDGRRVLTFAKGYPYITDLRQTKGHVSAVRDGCWHPAAAAGLATCGDDGTVRLWDAETAAAACVETIKLRPAAGAAPFAAAATASAGASTSAAGQQLRNGLATRLLTTAVAYAPSGRSLAVAATDGVVRVFDASAGSKYLFPALTLPRAHAPGTTTSCVAFAPGDSHILVTRGGDGDGAARERHPGAGHNAAVAAGADAGTVAWTVAPLLGYQSTLSSSSGDGGDNGGVGDGVAAAHARAGSVKVWDLRSPRAPLAAVYGLGNRFDGTDVCWSPDGRWLVTGVSAVSDAGAAPVDGALAGGFGGDEAGQTAMAAGLNAIASASDAAADAAAAGVVKREPGLFDTFVKSEPNEDGDDFSSNAHAAVADRSHDDDSDDDDDDDGGMGRFRAPAPTQAGGGVAFLSTATWAHCHTASLPRGASGIRVRWPATLDQVFASTSLGTTAVAFTRGRSTGGVLPALGKRAKPSASAAVSAEHARYDGATVFAPGSEDDPQTRKRREALAQRKALGLSTKPGSSVATGGAAAGAGTAAESGRAVNAIYHELLRGQIRRSQVISGEDPREALLRHHGEGLPSWTAGAYAKTQPKPVFAEAREGEEVEVEVDATAGKAKVLSVAGRSSNSNNK